jgi:hypothetical protein
MNPQSHCDSINDASQSAINILRLEPRGPEVFQGQQQGVLMSMISVASMNSISAARPGDSSAKSVALFCCVGLVVSLCLIASGIDLGAGWV